VVEPWLFRANQLLDMLGGVEYFFACPYCSERISMVLDTSVKRQTYIEDCEVCCQPIEVHYAVKDDEVCQFEARAI
jgi:Cysteine-rich CPXCG